MIRFSRAALTALLGLLLAPGAAPSSGAERAVPAGDEAIRQEFLARADDLVRDRNYQVSVTDHYEVKTDDPRVDPQAVAELLESFRTFFDTFWKENWELKPYEDRSRIYLFYSYYKYNELLTGNKRFGSFRPSGHYRPFFDTVVTYSDSVAPEGLPELMVHEAAHQLMEQRLFGRPAPRSPWLSEGMASYFGYTARDEKGRFQVGRVGGKRAALVRGASRGKGREASARLADFRQALKRRPSFSITSAIDVDDPSLFYGDGVEWRYTAAWLFVHFLMHGDGGAHREGFRSYLEQEALGQRGVDLLLEDLGLSAERLDTAYRDYVRHLKAR
jgi:hypothetical protein